MVSNWAKRLILSRVKVCLFEMFSSLHLLLLDVHGRRTKSNIDIGSEI